MSVKNLVSINNNLFFYGILILVFSLTFFINYQPYIEGDTKVLVDSSYQIIKCLKNNEFTHCPNLTHFPLLQHLISLIVSPVSKNPTNNAKLLSFINLFSFSLSCVLLFRILLKKTSINIAILGLLIFLTGFNLYYAYSSFNELTTSTLILIALITNLKTKTNWPKIIFFSIMAGISKEVAWPIIILLNTTAQLTKKLSIKKFFRSITPTILGIVFSIIINSLFNLYRYGTITNPILMNPLFMVKNNRNSTSFFLGLFFSSSGGLLFFWPSLSALIIFSISTIIHQWKQNYLNLLVVLVLIIQNIGLAQWFAPFGWIAWGPRLTLPLLPSCLLLLLIINQKKINTIIQKIFSKKILTIGFFLFFAITGISNYATLIFPQESLNQLFAPSPKFPTPAVIQQNQAYYYQSINELIWRKNPILYKNVIDAIKFKTTATLPYFLLLLVLFTKLKKYKKIPSH